MSDNNVGVTPEVELLPGLNVYKGRCTECKKETSSKGNPMLVQTFEIFGHPQDALNGMTIQNWATMNTKTVAGFDRQRESLGLAPVGGKFEQVDPLDYKGAECAFSARVESEEQKNEVTGETLINPNTGKPVMSHRRRIVQFLPKQ